MATQFDIQVDRYKSLIENFMDNQYALMYQRADTNTDFTPFPPPDKSLKENFTDNQYELMYQHAEPNTDLTPFPPPDKSLKENFTDNQYELMYQRADPNTDLTPFPPPDKSLKENFMDNQYELMYQRAEPNTDLTPFPPPDKSLKENFMDNQSKLIYQPAGTNRDEGQTASYTDVAPYIPAETTNIADAERDILNSKATWEGAQKAYKQDPNDPGAFAGFISYMANLSKREGGLLRTLHTKFHFDKITTAGQESLRYTPKTSTFHQDFTKEMQVKKIERSGVDPPGEWEIRAAAEAGTVLGQIAGPLFNNAFNMTLFEFEKLITNILSPTHIDFAQNDKNPAGYTIINSYLPSLNRLEQPKPIVESLDAILQQNLLLPGDNPTATEVFRNTYIENRGAERVNARTDYDLSEGVIGGVSVKDTKERLPRPGSTGQGKRDELFTYQEDAERLSPKKQHLGFTQNINVNAKKGSLMPAVTQSGESLGHSNNQFFPFMFETENRDSGGQFNQYCFLQATLNQLQESYQPTWASKSFFGRTEKVHNYSDTERVFDIQFVIFADSMRELQNVYERTNWLAQQCYGSHEVDNQANINRIKTGPLVRVTIGDIFQQVPGYIRNLSFNWDFGGPGGKWEVTHGLKMPVMVQVSLSYQVIHESLPHRDFDFYWGMQAGIQLRDNLIPTEKDGSKNTDKKTENELYVNLLQRKYAENAAAQTADPNVSDTFSNNSDAVQEVTENNDSHENQGGAWSFEENDYKWSSSNGGMY